MVVELRYGRVPADNVELTAVVIRMAGGTRAAGPVATNERRVEAALFIKPRADLLMTLDALVLGRTFGEVMATGAVAWPVE